MPNTFSMSPGYIARYKKKHRLRKFPLDCFTLLRRRLAHLFADPQPLVRGRAARRDARSTHKWLKPDSIDLVVTSPPYLRVVRYGKYNWIRLWLLGHSIHDVDRGLAVEATDRSLNLSDQLYLPKYVDFLRATFQSIGHVLRPGGTAVFVIGDVEEGGADQNLAATVWREVCRSVPFSRVALFDDVVELDSKVTRIWGGRRGEATKRDRILVLRRHGAHRLRPRHAQVVLSKLQPGIVR